MRTIHLRVSDAGTGEATPCRLRVAGPAGEHFAPLGRSGEFSVNRAEDVGGNLLLAKERWAITGGSCEIPLPDGVPLRVRAVKGPEFAPLDVPVTLNSGQMALRFTLTRGHDARARGWHPGDPRAHFLTPDCALLEARAEDLAVVDLLALDYRLPSLDGHTYPTFPNLDAFSGAGAARESGGAAVVVGTLNAHPVLGRVALLRTHRPVFPLAFGPPDAADDWGVSAWCRQARRKTGLVVWAQPFDPPHGGEGLVALVNGDVDAVEADDRPRKVPFLPAWYRLLTAGVRAPLVGASGKDSNRVPLGGCRTYAHIPPGTPFTVAAWAGAVRAGHTFATTGPLLTFAVADQLPGGTLPAGRAYPVRATAWSLAPFDRLEVVQDGAVIAAAPGERRGAHFAAEVACEVSPATAGWAAARAGGPAGFLNPDRPLFAHTSAVTFTGYAHPRRAAVRAGLALMIGNSREWMATVADVPDPAARAGLLAEWDAASARLGAP